MYTFFLTWFAPIDRQLFMKLGIVRIHPLKYSDLLLVIIQFLFDITNDFCTKTLYVQGCSVVIVYVLHEQKRQNGVLIVGC